MFWDNPEICGISHMFWDYPKCYGITPNAMGLPQMLWDFPSVLGLPQVFWGLPKCYRVMYDSHMCVVCPNMASII
jgi:hypothetical protein